MGKYIAIQIHHKYGLQVQRGLSLDEAEEVVEAGKYNDASSAFEEDTPQGVEKLNDFLKSVDCNERVSYRGED